MTFAVSDATWLLFVSEPTEFICASESPGLNDNGWFQLNATSAITGYVRLALGNNCTNGISPNFCAGDTPSNQTQYMSLLRGHANVISTGSNIGFTQSKTSSGETYDTYIDWLPVVVGEKSIKYEYQSSQLLSFSLQNHREMLVPAEDSPNTMLSYGCQPSLYGPACPVIGGRWKLSDRLADVSFLVENEIKEDLEVVLFPFIF